MTTGPDLAATTLRDRMRTSLKEAMRSRDKLAVSALRSGLAAIDNAEAVPVAPTTQSDDSPIAGAAIGLGVTEAPRRELTLEDLRAVLRREVDERVAAATEVEAAGRPDRAADLRHEAEVLGSVLPTGDDTIGR